MSVAYNPIRSAEFETSALPLVSARAAVRGWVQWPLYLLLVAAPLGFGATSVRASLIFTAAAWLVFCVWIADSVRGGSLQFAGWPVLLPALALLAYTAMHWALGISADPAATQLEWLRWVGVLCVALTAAACIGDSAQLRQACSVLALAGAAIAIFGIAQYITSNGKIYWVVTPAQGGWMFGPYVNRNHFAGLMELWIPLALGLALMPHNTFMRRWLWSLAALLMGAAVALSGSRGGLLAIGVEVLVIAFAVAAFRGRRPLIALAVSVALIAGAVAALGRGEIFERYQQSLQLPKLQQEESAARRLDAWRGALAIFRQHPVTGTGLDTFVTHFPAVRTFATDKVWTHAHNDFLQFLAETGLIGVALAGWVLIAAGRHGWSNVQRTAGTATGALLVAMAAACIGFMVHGWLDFNFHVPANAANFAAIGAILARPGWDED